MMCIPSINKVFWSYGLLLALERVVVVPIPAMTCAICWPEQADGERIARAEAMLHIMRGKARAGFGGGQAMATHGLTLHRSAGLALAKRAMKLARNLEAHFDPDCKPSVLIEEGIALLDAD